jgi:hypothetical protein
MSADIADPVIAMCADWHALHREVMAAYKRVPEFSVDDPNGAAQAEAEAIQERADALCEQIAATAPRSVEGIIAQASVAAAEMEWDCTLDDNAVLCAHRILSNIARFAG